MLKGNAQMKSLSSLSDDELLIEFQSGNCRAYEVIYNRYWKPLFRHAKAMLQNEEEAKDVVQDVFTTLWTKAQSLSFDAPLKAFLFRSTRNSILNRLKHLKVAAKYETHLLNVIDNPILLPDSLVIQKDLARVIDEGIQSLPAKMREIFVKSRKQHLSHKDISAELNISDKTVKRQVSNAISILKGKLSLHELLIYFLFFYIH